MEIWKIRLSFLVSVDVIPRCTDVQKKYLSKLDWDKMVW